MNWNFILILHFHLVFTIRNLISTGIYCTCLRDYEWTPKYADKSLNDLTIRSFAGIKRIFFQSALEPRLELNRTKKGVWEILCWVHLMYHFYSVATLNDTFLKNFYDDDKYTWCVCCFQLQRSTQTRTQTMSTSHWQINPDVVSQRIFFNVKLLTRPFTLNPIAHRHFWMFGGLVRLKKIAWNSISIQQVLNKSLERRIILIFHPTMRIKFKTTWERSFVRTSNL